jgi:hypothetical protein
MGLEPVFLRHNERYRKYVLPVKGCFLIPDEQAWGLMAFQDVKEAPASTATG